MQYKIQENMLSDDYMLSNKKNNLNIPKMPAAEEKQKEIITVFH